MPCPGLAWPGRWPAGCQAEGGIAASGNVCQGLILRAAAHEVVEAAGEAAAGTPPEDARDAISFCYPRCAE